MLQEIANLILDESKWFVTSLGIALGVTILWAARLQERPRLNRRNVLAAMNLSYACVIGMMASGHLLAVSVKVAQGSLSGSPWLLYPLGLVLLTPAVLLLTNLKRARAGELRATRRVTFLNIWLAVALVVLGIRNFVLAIPAILNVCFLHFPRRKAAIAIAAIAMLVYVGLFVGSLSFLLRGGSFEEFSRMNPNTSETGRRW